MARRRFYPWLRAFLFVVVPATVSAQLTPIQRIRANPQSYLNEKVTLVGKVVRYVDAKGSNAFYFEDEYGTQMRIVSTNALPALDSRWSLEGVVALEPTGDPYLIESRRASVDQPPTSATAPPVADTDLDGVMDTADRCPNTPMATKVDPAGCEPPNRLPLYAGLGALALALIGSGVYVARRSQPAPPPPPPSIPTPDPLPHPAPKADDVFEGKTVRFFRPSQLDATLKLVPGRLVIASGPDKGNEIRFVHVGAPVPEITFGRSEGPRYTHISLTAPTVSRRHAMMRYEGGTWSIANFSDTNPATVNATPLASIGAPVALKDGDIIEFGEVSFRFHAR